MRPRPDDGCPLCGQGPLVPMVWGLPDRDLIAAAARGEVILGGCVVNGPMPWMLCRHCAGEFLGEPGRLAPGDVVDVPTGEAPLEEILDFALTYDGYFRHGDVEGVKRFAEDVLLELEANGRVRSRHRADVLRCALFFLQRQSHHWGYLPDQHESWMRQLVVAIGEVTPRVHHEHPAV